MRKLTLLFIASVLFVSCGKNKGEQMLTDYKQKQVSRLNIDLKDLDFKISKVERLGDVTAADSMRIIEDKFLQKEIWEAIKDSTDAGKIKMIRYYGIARGFKRSTIDELLVIAQQYIDLSKDTSKVISARYKASYSLKNPLLKTKQTFDEVFLTDAEETKFVKKEE